MSHTAALALQLGTEAPAVIATLAELMGDLSSEPRFLGCFIVVPMPDGWRLFAKRFPVGVAKPNCLARFWLEDVLPVVLDEWTSATRFGTDLEDQILDLDLGFPRGILARQPNGDDCEIWHGGGVADWMNVSPRSVEVALGEMHGWPWRLVEDFLCFREKGTGAAKVFGIEHKWWSETGLSGC